MSVPILRFVVQESRLTKEVKFALQTLSDMMGYVCTFKEDPDADAILSYGPHQPPENSGNALHIHQEDSFWFKKILPQFKKVGEFSFPAVPNQEDSFARNEVPYDLVFVFYFFLSGKIELGEMDKDEHGRPLPAKCYLGRNQIYQVPLLNQYVLYLRDKLQSLTSTEKKPVSLWPHGKRYAVALSHDVDSLAKSWFLSMMKNTYLTIKKPFDLKRIAKRSLDLVSNHDFANNFTSIIEYERRLGISSTFFFGSLFDDYDMSNPRVLSAIKCVNDKKWEVGLHPTYKAYSNEEHFRREKQALESCTGGNIRGVRHHFWRMDFNYAENTLLLHEKLGFQYDCSLGFNDDIGFRRGCALPYHPFHLELFPLEVNGRV